MAKAIRLRNTRSARDHAQTWADIGPLLFANIRQLLTLRGTVPRRGPELAELGIIEDGAVLCLGGKIVAVGVTRELLRHPWVRKNRRKLREIDCRQNVVLPGFVDSHTHPVFVSPRLVDFEKRIAGASSEEIAEAGGGIRSSIDAVRRTPRKALAERVLAALADMTAHGTTTVEAKSGYGLSVESELKSLEAIREAARHWPGTLVPTLLGAHVVPPEFKNNPREYVRQVAEEMVPQAARRKLAQWVDIFVEHRAFSGGDAETILAAAQANGLGVRAHLSQMSNSPVAPFLRLTAASLDHMDHVSEEDISALAQSPTVATLLPAANYFLGLEKFPPARKLIEAGVAVAIATDYNPGTAPVTSMPFVLSVACTHMKMSPAEAIAASTVNGACALRLQQFKGSIERGKDADLAVFDVQDYREIPYWLGANRCRLTVLNGNLFSRPQ